MAKQATNQHKSACQKLDEELTKQALDAHIAEDLGMGAELAPEHRQNV